MKTKYIVMAMALMLYAIYGYGQLPDATLITPSGQMYPDHVMLASSWDQFAPSIAIDKNNFPNILISFATTYYNNNQQYNYQGYYYSPDGGVSVYGSPISMPNGTWYNGTQSHGWASTAFDNNSLGYLMGRNGDNTGFFTVTTSTDGVSWSTNVPNNHVASSELIDVIPCGNVMGTADDAPSSPYVNNYYAVWVDQTSTPSLINVETSTNYGASFGYKNTLNYYNSSGPNIQTGPNGQVYVCWEDYGNNSNTTGTDIGFSKSLDGGHTFTQINASLAADGLGPDFEIGYSGLSDNGTGSTNPNFNNTQVNSYPSMAVYKGCGTNPGIIYIVAAVQVYNGSVIDMWYSIDDGGSWSAPIVISRSDQQYCWFPWIAVDDVTGVASVVYYGYSGSASNTNTFVSYSNPSDPTQWGNIKVSSSPQLTSAYNSNINGFAIGPDDANGIAAYNGHAYPVWKDTRSGLRQIWIADISYDAPQLYSSATNQYICPNSLTGANIITGVTNYAAAEKILVSTATCSISGTVTIANTATVSMTAGQSITIGPGFSTQPGAVFTAKIESNITACQTPGVPVLKSLSATQPDEDIALTKKDIDGADLYAYPNPTNDHITVEVSNSSYQNVSFTVTDLSGRVMAQYSNPSISSTDVTQIIDASMYAQGLYIVTMRADNQNYSIKFAKQ